MKNTRGRCELPSEESRGWTVVTGGPPVTTAGLSVTIEGFSVTIEGLSVSPAGLSVGVMGSGVTASVVETPVKSSAALPPGAAVSELNDPPPVGLGVTVEVTPGSVAA